MGNKEIYIYIKDGEVSMWQKHFMWHKWFSKTPKQYADVLASLSKTEPDYSPCWWGMYDESPEEHGYTLVGVIRGEAGGGVGGYGGEAK